MVLARTDRPVASEPTLDWRRQAACRTMPAEMFFPVGSTGLAVEDVQAAKSVCGTCEVRTRCLDFALTSRQEFGVWGGTDEDERRLMLKAARAGRSAG